MMRRTPILALVSEALYVIGLYSVDQGRRGSRQPWLFWLQDLTVSSIFSIIPWGTLSLVFTCLNAYIVKGSYLFFLA